MRLLAFSDLHCDLDQAARLVEAAADADVVVGAGDFASIHDGPRARRSTRSRRSRPRRCSCPGNNETEAALREAAAAWPAATVLHGEGDRDRGRAVLRPRRRACRSRPGTGASTSPTPRPPSCSAGCPEDAVLVVHSPPRGHVDRSGAGDSLGSYRDPRGDRGQATAARGVRAHPRELGHRVAARHRRGSSTSAPPGPGSTSDQGPRSSPAADSVRPPTPSQDEDPTGTPSRVLRRAPPRGDAFVVALLRLLPFAGSLRPSQALRPRNNGEIPQIPVRITTVPI